MSHRLAVMDSGHVAQVGTPVEVYEQPATAYVADFLGVANLLAAAGERRAGRPLRRAPRRVRPRRPG